MSASLDFKILGSLAVSCAGVPVRLAGPRQRTVLAMLLLNPDDVVSIDRITDALWQGRPPRTSKTQIAICIAALRKSFKEAGCEDDIIVTSAPGYLINVRGQRLDAREFTEQLAQARAVARKHGPLQAAEQLSAALDLWRGPALAGMTSQTIQSQVAHLDEQRLAAIEELAGLRLELGEHRSLVTPLQELVDEHPLREQARGYLMLATYRSGRRAEACELYRSGRTHFIEELGIEPGPFLQSLHEQMLNDDPSLTTTPQQQSSTQSRAVPAQLPANVAGFTGRSRELALLDELAAEHRDDGCAAIGYITGEAGIGKSSLAIFWAHRSSHLFPNGQLFADLHGEDGGNSPDPYQVLEGFLRALGVTDEQMPVNRDERLSLYRSMLAERKVLIVLDNVGPRSRVLPLLPGSGRCCVLITGSNAAGELIDSHAPRRIQLARMSTAESTELVAEIVGRARVAAEPKAASYLASLCGGLPLALRIAAAKLVTKPHLTIQRLVERLTDPHQRLSRLSHSGLDLRSRLWGKYRELDPVAARLYRCLGMLELCEFTSAMAASILEVGVDEAEDVAERLADAQLLDARTTSTRGNVVYHLPEFARFYAAERGRIEESPECGRELTERLVHTIA